jgi:cell division protein FtsW (lipid II flippase)
MLRAFGLFGLGGLFLIISPDFRETLLGGIASGLDQMAQNSPWSYIGAGVLTLILLMVYMYRTAQPR